jgi:hypothetical protein
VVQGSRRACWWRCGADGGAALAACGAFGGEGGGEGAPSKAPATVRSLERNPGEVLIPDDAARTKKEGDD